MTECPRGDRAVRSPRRRHWGDSLRCRCSSGRKLRRHTSGVEDDSHSGNGCGGIRAHLVVEGVAWES